MNVKPALKKFVLFWLQLFLFSLWVSANAAADPFDKGLLWKIDGHGVAPSYLFGTMHSEDPQITRLPGAVQQAFDRSAGVTLEVSLDMQSLLAMTTAFMLTDGTTLEEHIGPELYRRAVNAMVAQGKPEVVVAMMKPWAVAVTLMLPPSETGMVLDLVLYQQALSAGKTVTGLESATEQMDVFDDMPGQEQIELLEDALDNLQDMPKMLQALKAAYLARDLKQMAEISEQSIHDSSKHTQDHFNQRLLVDRNHRMAERMQPQLRKGGEFIAVGAMHLPGKQGLLNLLTQQGYTVSRLY